MSADYVTFAAHNFAKVKISYVFSHFHDLSHELMAHYHGDGNGFLSPFVPIVDVKVSSTDARAIYFDQNVIVSDFGLGDVFKP